MGALSILQWNAQGLLNHGPELINHLNLNKDVLYHVICVQETWFNHEHILDIPQYICFNRNREIRSRGGCAIYIHESIHYEYPINDKEIEMQLTKIHFAGSVISIVNFYNPCKRLDECSLNKIIEGIPNDIFLIVGDFNSHNPVWGSTKTDQNGKTLENFIQNKNLVILNDGTGTRIDPCSGKTSCLDLSFTSPKLAGKCMWEVLEHTFGSDHFPISTQILLDRAEEANKNRVNDNEETIWSFKNFDWNIFTRKCERGLTEGSKNLTDPIDMYEEFIKKLTEIIREAQPKKSKKKHNPVPWWSHDCTKIIKERNRANNKLKRHISTENLNIYLKKKAEAQKILRQAERNYWQNFCQRLNPYVPESMVWSTIKRLKGSSNQKRKSQNIPVLKDNEREILSDKEKAETFSSFFQSISKVKECIEIGNEQTVIKSMDRGMDHVLNEPLTIQELQKALNSCKQSAPGKDMIPYQVYQKLPVQSKQYMLKIMNLIWDTGDIPTSLKHSILIPVLKQDKDPHNVSSYRPIALTSCFAKILERVIKYRLQWFVEKKGIFPPFMSGFRAKRNVLDNIILLENTVQRSINVGEYTLVVFLDIEKAYDRLNIKGLMYKLAINDISGNMLQFLDNFLKERTFQVKIGQDISECYEMYNGLPQGSVLSPLLYNIMMCDIPTDEYITTSVYADDCAIWISGNDIEFISDKLQYYLNTLEKWFTKWGFRLSQSKTVPVLFTKKNKFKYPELRLNNTALSFQSKKKFLGMIFDQKLSWKTHIDMLVSKCKRKINILRCLTGTTWGSSSKMLLIVYKALIRSLLDFGCEAYDSAPSSVKQPLDSIQYQSLRICAGALPLTSLEALQTELGEMPLDLRRQMLADILRQKIAMHRDHPVNANHNWQMDILKHQKNFKPFGCRTVLMNDISIETYTITCLPPWIIISPDISLELSEVLHKHQNPLYLQQRSLELIGRKWSKQLHIFTDGSKVPNYGTASASFYVPAFSYHQAKRMADHTSSFRAELAAIVLALNWLENIDVYVDTVIFSDSLSAIHAIKEEKDITFVTEIITLTTKLNYLGKQIHIEWIPSHCGLHGNEMADHFAKAALQNDIEIFNKLSLSEIKTYITKKYTTLWQDRWNASHTFLRQVQSAVDKPHLCSLTRFEESIVHRLRLGITGLNEDLFKLKIHPTGHCNNCIGIKETVFHFLTECPKYITERAMLLTETNLTNPKEIMTLLKSTENKKQKSIVRFVLRTKRIYEK